MIIVVAVIVAVDIMRMTGADLRRLIDVPIKHLWMVWLALAIQVVVLWLLADHVTGWVGDVGHMLTCALAGAFAYVNRRVPGILIMCAGEGLNLIATAANGGRMPASAGAWRTVGGATTTNFTDSGPVANPRLPVLGDIFAVPKGWPLADVFSIGDVMLVLGLMWLLYRSCRPPLGGRTRSYAPREGSRSTPALDARRNRPSNVAAAVAHARVLAESSNGADYSTHRSLRRRTGR
ncbi:MAG: diguanylate cyclase/phosphodiesterase & domain with sensor(s) [Acidimicrobiales bacterium]|nr:diguanylate cyclase/phosphodiesterase & domain with sensor(s) [Acidimicrobiales bacterium]